MRCAVELSDIHHVVLVFQNCSLVVVDIEVVRRAENRHYAREASRPSLSIHAISCILRFVSADDGEQVVLFKEAACGWIREEVRAAADMVVREEFLRLLLAKLFEGIGP